MAEQISNTGYLGFKKQSDKLTPVIPDKYFALYETDFVTDVALDEDNQIIGNKARVYQTIQGLRNHKGTARILAEPNTAAYLMDMFMTKSGTAGSDPYTHSFVFSGTTDPNAYTIDLKKGRVVQRLWGCEIDEISIEFDENKMIFNVNFSALGSFMSREISTVVGAVVTFKTNYDPTPTKGLLNGDILSIYDVSAGTYSDFTISTVDSGTQITLTASPSGIVAGDIMFLRAASASLSVKTPFLWSRSEFRFADTAADALTASQTRLEKGSKWTLTHKFEDEKGAQRSGSFDPAALVRTQADATLEAKMFFDDPVNLNKFLTNSKKACVIRHFSETGYELRVTLNNLKFTEYPVPLNSGEIIYAESKLIGTYDASDGQMCDVKVINAVSSI